MDFSVHRIAGYFKTQFPAHVADNILQKFAFTYFLYRNFCDKRESQHFEKVTFDVIERIKKGEEVRSLYKTFSEIADKEVYKISYSPFQNKEELIEAVRSAHDDYYFYSNNYKSPDGMQISLMLDDLSSDELLQILDCTFEGSIYDESTPESVALLAMRARNTYDKTNISFLDMCSSTGSLLLKYGYVFKKVDGVEINTDNIMLAKMRLYARCIQGDIRNNSCFIDSYLANSNGYKYDFVFSEFPWGLLYHKDIELTETMKRCNGKRLPIEKPINADYYFISAILNYLKPNGIGAFVVPLSTLSNLSDIKVREALIKSGYIKEIIALPSKIFNRTNVSTALVLVGLNPTEKIALFDGTSYFTQKDRTHNAIDVHRLLNDFEEQKRNGTCFFDYDDFSKHDFCLSPVMYVNDIKKVIPDATELSETAEIFTGWQVTSAKLEEIHKTDGSGIRLLQMSNVENGVISSELQKYDIPENTIQKFRLESGDVVISTKSLKVKSAVFDGYTNEPVVASGSIMVIRPKTNVLDPYFLAAFFESDLGKQTIQLYQTGSVIPNLSINNVKKIPIPLLKYEKQVEIGKAYRDLRDLIISERQRLSSLEKKVKNMLDELWNKREE